MAQRPLLLLLLALPVAGCVAPGGGGGSASDDDDTPADDGNVCRGDALADGVPISDDQDALAERFDVNEDLCGSSSSESPSVPDPDGGHEGEPGIRGSGDP
jgi:hypothetical protein